MGYLQRNQDVYFVKSHKCDGEMRIVAAADAICLHIVLHSAVHLNTSLLKKAGVGTEWWAAMNASWIFLPLNTLEIFFYREKIAGFITH